MKLAGTSTVLRIIVAESDTLHGKSLYEEIVKKAEALLLEKGNDNFKKLNLFMTSSTEF